MTSVEQAWLSWSSGKDSALSLHELRASDGCTVTGLITTLDFAADRVAMHGVRRALVQAQADALGLPLHLVELPWPCPNDVYEQRMSTALVAAEDSGVSRLVFGDLYLADIRAYREQSLTGTDLTAVFPLWERPTTELASQVLHSGIRALITCVDPEQAPHELAGRWYDQQLVDALPPSVDPCGENGEFHTFVVDGPDFAHPLNVTVGDITDRNGFVYADILPA